MHKTNYRPSRSQQLYIANLIKEKGFAEGDIIVHHVLEDSFTRLFVQCECRYKNYVYFARYEL